jgi:antitoxin MazE
MIVQFSRWGNSVAVRIPSNVLKDVGASEGTSAELTVISGKVVLNPISSRPSYTLDELLAGITKDNLHEEIDFGPPVGSEIW